MVAIHKASLRAEVEAEFGDDEALDLGHVIYMPPWRTRLGDNTLGPWYGPKKASQYVKLQRAYEESLEGGGNWDRAQEIKTKPRLLVQDARKKAERFDFDKMARFVSRNSTRISGRELEIYLLYYEQGLGLGHAAREIGISRNNAKAILHNLRTRMRGLRK